MTTAHSPAADRPLRRHWLGAVFLFAAAFITMLDTTIVNLALPAIQVELSASHNSLQWTLVAYALTFAAGLLPFGRFGDVFGRRRLFLLGLAGFVLASTICGAAPTIETLVLARFAQGLAASMMMPQVLAIVHESFPEDEKAKAIGCFGMVTALGAMAGPLIGGVVISADLWGLGWRVIFLINLPLGILALVGAWHVLPTVRLRRSHTVDWTGTALFAVAAVTVLYPVMEGRTLGWPPGLVALFGLSLATAALFWWHQHHRAAQGADQTLPVCLLDNPRFLSGIAMVTALFVGIAGTIVVLAIVLQSGLGLSPAQAGVALAAHPFSVMIASMSSGRLGTRHLAPRASAGMMLLFLGMGLLRLIINETTPVPVLWVPLVFVGAGVGTAAVAMYQLVLREVRPAEAGAGSGALQAFQQVGIALGIALVGQLYFAGLGNTPDPVAHVAALKQALWLPLTIYAGLSLLVLYLFRKSRTAQVV